MKSRSPRLSLFFRDLPGLDKIDKSRIYKGHIINSKSQSHPGLKLHRRKTSFYFFFFVIFCSVSLDKTWRMTADIWFKKCAGDATLWHHSTKALISSECRLSVVVEIQEQQFRTDVVKQRSLFRWVSPTIFYQLWYVTRPRRSDWRPLWW